MFRIHLPLEQLLALSLTLSGLSGSAVGSDPKPEEPLELTPRPGGAEEGATPPPEPTGTDVQGGGANEVPTIAEFRHLLNSIAVKFP